MADFTLTERSGRTLTRADLRGRPFVMDFVFTTCTGPCPALSAGMAELQEAVAGTPVRLVTVSVDPGHDSPEVLTAYAQAFGADPEQWLFLTGAEDQVAAIAASVQLALARAPEGQARLGEQVVHSTKLIVVDGQGLVRGYYDGTSDEGRRGAAERALHLAR